MALKHHTSKLSSYSDIASLQTFGFRGEALASLCALSNLSITTCQATEVPKGTKLTFEISGKLKDTSVIAAQKGTTVSIEKLFYNLPVRRRELERNIKREWHKVIALLNQYACIQTNLKFSVSQQPTKGKRILLFSTKGNATTRDNIINIFGAKAMTAMVTLDLELEMQPTKSGPALQKPDADDQGSTKVQVVGHVSRPAHGEGRQTPDRQMFFVNGRPCGLPQFAKTFNEVYKSYNNHQSPFIFADIQLDTHLYDVNVSPDKRSILLHDQNQLLDTLRSSLIELFDAQDYTVPTSRLPGIKQTLSADNASSRRSTPISKPIPVRRADEESRVEAEKSDKNSDEDGDEEESEEEEEEEEERQSNPKTRGTRIMPSRLLRTESKDQSPISWYLSKDDGRRRDSSSRAQAQPHSKSEAEIRDPPKASNSSKDSLPTSTLDVDKDKPLPVRDFNRLLAENSPAVIPNSDIAANASKSRSLDANDEDNGEDRREIEDENEEGKDEDEDEDEDEEIVEEPAIPAIQPLRMAQPDVSLPQSQSPVRLKRFLREQPTVMIGGDAVTSSPEQPLSKRQRRVDDTPTPSFNGRLNTLFSANATASEQETGPSLIQNNIVSEDEEDSPSASPSRDVGDKNNPIPNLLGPIATEKQASDESDMDDDGELEPAEAEGETGLAEPRAQSFASGGRRRDTLQLLQNIQLGEPQVWADFENWAAQSLSSSARDADTNKVEDLDDPEAESQLSLIINKGDFSRMRIAGQFNLGFIIATRPANTSSPSESDELFIIDQHASDEKYNFERLQETTVVQSQRLVHPKRLDLTALEEEIVLENIPAIESNGFKIEVDNTGDYPVGARCLLTSLPLSRETTFSLTDLEELIALLGDDENAGGSANRNHIPRPSKVRKMFAMRACRSSIMIGKALNMPQMHSVVRHMGGLDKPWNCLHGRPTMRHLCRLDGWDEKGWRRDGMGDGKLWDGYL